MWAGKYICLGMEVVACCSVNTFKEFSFEARVCEVLYEANILLLPEIKIIIIQKPIKWISNKSC